MDNYEDFVGFIRIVHMRVYCYDIYKFTAELFNSANDKLHIKASTTKNWFKEGYTHSKSYMKKFKKGRAFKEFDDYKFIKFLKDTIQGWTAIQKEFKSQLEHTGLRHEIDFATPDEDKFFKSLMKQFKSILGISHEKEFIIRVYDDFNRFILDCNMENFINAEPVISYIYDKHDRFEDTEDDWNEEEAIANLNSVLKSLGIDEANNSEDEADDSEDDDEDKFTLCPEIESATLSVNSDSIYILKHFLIIIEDLVNSIQPKESEPITIKEYSYVKKIVDFIELLKSYHWVIEMGEITEDGTTWTAADESMSILYCNQIVSYHNLIKKMYDEICDIYNSLIN